MKFKKLIFSTLIILITTYCFAKSDLDSTIKETSADIQKRLNRNAILCILDFSSSSKSMSEYIQAELITDIINNASIRIVTRAHLDKINKELNYQTSGYVSEETALSICRQLGANEIVFGQLEELDNKYMLQVRMLEVETASYLLFKSYEITRSAKTEQLLHHAATIYKSSIGIIAEGNKNSLSGIAAAGGISFDYSVLRRLSLGAKVIVSYDFLEKDNSIFTLEPLGTIRWYVVSPSGEPSAGLFAEGECGPELIFVNSELQTIINGGFSLGFRFTAGSFYFEPYLRGGYPYLFGTGINFGFRF